MRADLTIAHTLVPETEFVDGEITLPGDDRAIERGERILRQARELATDAVEDGDGLSIETELLAGRPAHSIAAHAESVDADAIYVGHRGLSEKREQVVGSVAKSVLDRASVPVTVVR
jgi:nucleotide-binding universal stress UspA family protein